ncbi:MAG: DUF5916 domain-containing protein [Saprospiraceae bacterium]|nr:DUF5916 domain-containing protein [Saprospiraceae bacterium]
MKSLSLLVLFIPVLLCAQIDAPAFELHIQKTNQPIKVDGLSDEPAWQTADVAQHFKMTFPVDSSYTQYPTEIRMCFDDKFLYIAAKCTQKRNTYTVQSLKRDFPNGTSDVLNFIVDPFKDGLNGFLFSLNPLNVQREALVDNGANLSYEWDNKWHSAVQNEDEYWSVEMAIPFKTLRYKVASGQNSWHVNFIRTFLKTWEVSTWRPIPQQFAANNLAFTGNLIWDTPPPSSGSNIALIPYFTSQYGVDYQRNEQGMISNRPSKKELGIGGDAKIAITPSLNLDLTINPDFSQVEVDRQVPNLSRFELFFPERRQFFLENRDLFATFGFPNTRPFFSRRIGLARNPVTGNNTTVPILAGARLSGKINDNWRIGVLNMQTKRVNWDSSQVLPAANFAVATVQRKVGSRSYIGAIVMDKENLFNGLSSEQKSGFEPWNRIAGVEYDLYSEDNRWEGEWYYHRSFSPDPKKRGGTLASFLSYNDRHFSANFAYLLVDSNFTSDAGFIQRKGVQNLYPGMSIRFYPGNTSVNTWGFGIDGNLTYSLDFQETDRDVFLYSNVEFKNQSGLNLGVYNNYTYLFEDFDPTNQDETDTQPLPGLNGYTYNGVRGSYYSSSSYNLQGTFDFSAGSFFNGSLLNVDGSLSYRWQPYGVFALGYNYNRIRLPKPYASSDFWLIGPRAELSFTKKLFFSAFFQYNTQANNFNINTRLQWRFAPVSDLFLVYTDNSYAATVPNSPIRFLAPKNKALVLKAVFWLNL